MHTGEPPAAARDGAEAPRPSAAAPPTPGPAVAAGAGDDAAPRERRACRLMLIPHALQHNSRSPAPGTCASNQLIELAPCREHERNHVSRCDFFHFSACDSSRPSPLGRRISRGDNRKRRNVIKAPLTWTYLCAR